MALVQDNTIPNSRLRLGRSYQYTTEKRSSCPQFSKSKNWVKKKKSHNWAHFHCSSKPVF